MPVDSTTTSTPSSPQGSAAGSRSASHLILEPPATMLSPVTATSTSSVPRTVSYLSRCANVLMSPRSLAATISIPGLSIACTARQKFRPIRPNPLIPTRTVTCCSPLVASVGTPPVPADHTTRTLTLGPVTDARLPSRLSLRHRRTRRSRHQHLGGQVSFSGRHSELDRPLVGEGKQAPD